MRKAIIGIFILVGIGGAGAAIRYTAITKAPLTGEKGGIVTISADKNTFSGVIASNKDKFRGKIFIKIYNRLNDINISVIKGEYQFPEDISLEKLIESLSNGEYNTTIKRVTIPEGYTIEQIAETLEKNNIISSKEFINACENYELPMYIKTDAKRRYALEGYLFPDTYMFQEGDSGEKIISKMISRFEEVLKEIQSENNIKINTDKIDYIIRKASVIEREVSNSEEKKLVSSVIDNRIEEGMKLQIDATVLYALGYHKDRVLYSDLKVQSPYNTYYVKGLPIGPISNPGKESIEAAILPESTDYLYYMTKDGDKHKFFKEYDEFLKYKNSN